MDIYSPPRTNKKPARLIEEDEVFESTRTSGVGEYECGTMHYLSVLTYRFNIVDKKKTF